MFHLLSRVSIRSACCPSGGHTTPNVQVHQPSCVASPSSPSRRRRVERRFPCLRYPTPLDPPTGPRCQGSRCGAIVHRRGASDASGLFSPRVHVAAHAGLGADRIRGTTMPPKWRAYIASRIDPQQETRAGLAGNGFRAHVEPPSGASSDVSRAWNADLTSRAPLRVLVRRPSEWAMEPTASRWTSGCPGKYPFSDYYGYGPSPPKDRRPRQQGLVFRGFVSEGFRQPRPRRTLSKENGRLVVVMNPEFVCQ